MMKERGLDADHSTVFRWVQRYAPEINKRILPHSHGGRAPEGVESLHVTRKGRVKGLAGSGARGQAKFVAPPSQIAA
jgi:hypothetical protein